MGYSLHICKAVEDDLGCLWESQESEAALWDELFDLLLDNAALREQLSRHNGYNAIQPHFDTVPVQQYLKQGFNVIRLKLYLDRGSPAPHRLLFTLQHTAADSGKICLLGLMLRSENYDPRSSFGSRICNQYDALGVAHTPRG